MPKGIYRTVHSAPIRGALATSCLTQALADYGLARGYLVPGRCPTGIQPVMKKILAVAGDVVVTDHDHLMVNGLSYPKIQIVNQDRKGRRLDRFAPRTYTVPEGQALLYSTHVDNSWDGRFWGAVPIEQVVEPVYVF